MQVVLQGVDASVDLDAQLLDALNDQVPTINEAVGEALEEAFPMQKTDVAQGSYDVTIEEEWTGLTLCTFSLDYAIDTVTLALGGQGFTVDAFNSVATQLDSYPMAIATAAGLSLNRLEYELSLSLSGGACGISLPLSGSASGTIEMSMDAGEKYAEY